MRRLLSLIVIVLLITTLIGCGSMFFVGGVINPDGSTIIGSVCMVQLSNVIDLDGSVVEVTFVTFLQSGISSTMTFCGDQRSQFPMDQTVQSELSSRDNPAQD